MKKTINLTATALAVAVATGASFATPETAQAEVSYNIGVHSKYLLRGIFEENSGAAVQGGADWSGESGFYAGYWFSSLGYFYQTPADGIGGDANVEVDPNKGYENGFENDFYGGYSGKITESFGFDVGIIQYVYVNVDDSDLTEAVGKLTYDDFYIKAQYLLNDGWWGNSGDTYLTAGYSMTVGGIGLAIDYGYYIYNDDDSNKIGGPGTTTSDSHFRNLNLTASKEFTKELSGYVQYVVAGQDRTAKNYNDSMVAGVTYSF